MKNKVAIVTGGASGIGAVISQVLAENGASVVVADINFMAAEMQSISLKEKGFDGFAVSVDISKEESVKKMVGIVIEYYKKIDILVNNAGIINAEPITQMTLDSWDRLIDINLRGTHLCSKEVISYMIENGYGRIVNISSMAGQIGGLKVSPDYTAAKAGIIGLAKSYARYGAQYGITVNAVAPGFIETDMTKGRDDPKSVPLGRLGTPKDVANAVYFLVSPLADYITGATIDVNGGLLMR